MEGRRAGGACFKMNNMNFRRVAQPKAGLAGCTTRQASELHINRRAGGLPKSPLDRPFVQPLARLSMCSPP